MAKQKWISDNGKSYDTEAEALKTDLELYQRLSGQQESAFLDIAEMARRDVKMWKARYEGTIQEAKAAEKAAENERINDSHKRNEGNYSGPGGGMSNNHP